MKKVGNKVNFRGAASYDYSENKCNSVSSRGIYQDVITKVFYHGVRTRKNGYINNKRILGYEL